ncbi:hypothetical protein [Brumimicrobium mesophilum]|uniref:hypothetical protein n=1 Tax=Brumimicrobium mesophilum TaxID=392717 RepID=UPI00131AA30D|nr:hypothetical protein [Brumimicrobium mesophilum]
MRTLRILSSFAFIMIAYSCNDTSSKRVNIEKEEKVIKKSNLFEPDELDEKVESKNGYYLDTTYIR